LKLLQQFILIFCFLIATSTVENKVFAGSSFSFQQIKPIKRDTNKTDSTNRNQLNNKVGKADTTKKRPLKKSSLDSKLEYAATDSTNTDKKNGIVYLYGNARVIYQGFQLDADYIKYDSKKNTIFASGVKNSKGVYVGRPIFKMGQEASSKADSITYNTKTGKGLVSGVYTEQEGGFFSGGRTKVQPDNELHISGTTYSTCNLPEPHFGMHITKGIATEKLIIAGPVYMEFERVPLPIALPFGIFPKPNKKSSGIILPTPGEDATRGFSLTNGGYYLALNDYWDARLTGNIFTNGSYDLNLATNYIKRYKYNGNFNLAYSSTRNGLEGTPAYKPQKNFHIGWTHSQNANARPGTTFSASVNAGTSNYFSTTAANGSYDINQIAQNTLNSSISYGKVFGPNGMFNLTTALTHSQETQQKTISLTLPQVSLNMSSLNPFDDKVGNQTGLERITLGYSMQASNSVSTQEDLLFQKGGLNRFKNGMQHTIPISLPFTLLQYLQFNSSVNYSERWYLQTINKRAIRRINGDSTAIDTVNGFKRAGEYSMSMGMSTKFYGVKQFAKLGNLKAIRHVITPSVSFSYKPDFSSDKFNNYKNLQYYTDDIRPGKSVPTGEFSRDYQGRIQKYSIFEQGLYGGPSAGEQASIGFSVDNNVELKLKSSKDTTGNGERKLAVLQGLTFSSSYNFVAPEKKLAPINFSGRSQFTEKLGLNFSGVFSPYAVDNVAITTGTGINEIKTYSLQEVDRYVWNDGKIPRLTNFSFSFDYSLNPEALKKRNENIDATKEQGATQVRTQEQNDQLAAISRDPNAFVDFNIPWNFAFSYSFNYSNPLSDRKTRTISNTLNFNGDFNLTPKWKVQFNSGYDFKAKNIAYTSFAIYRDLHCWDLSANWVPFGAYQSYSIDIKVKASILQDLKLSKRKGYYTKY
jgi:lipopolysaccharide assembly outer membrane protein LptD (OstA)